MTWGFANTILEQYNSEIDTGQLTQACVQTNTFIAVLSKALGAKKRQYCKMPEALGARLSEARYLSILKL